jgi:hypothetical protein
MMKKIFDAMFNFMDSFARARAATVLVRQGQYEAAKWLISGKS